MIGLGTEMRTIGRCILTNAVNTRLLYCADMYVTDIISDGRNRIT